MGPFLNQAAPVVPAAREGTLKRLICIFGVVAITIASALTVGTDAQPGGPDRWLARPCSAACHLHAAVRAVGRPEQLLPRDGRLVRGNQFLEPCRQRAGRGRQRAFQPHTRPRTRTRCCCRPAARRRRPRCASQRCRRTCGSSGRPQTVPPCTWTSTRPACSAWSGFPSRPTSISRTRGLRAAMFPCCSRTCSRCTNLGKTSVVFRFSPIGSASVQLDDVYIDPVFHE